MIKKMIASTAMLIALYNPVDAGQNLQPGYDLKHHKPIIRLQRQTNSSFGFADISDRLDYMEIRKDFDLGKRLKLSAEYNYFGNDDTIRLGISWTPKINDFTLIKYFPVESNGGFGSQLALFTTKKGKSLVVKYNPKSDLLFFEPTLEYKQWFIRGMGYNPGKWTTIIGKKCKF